MVSSDCSRFSPFLCAPSHASRLLPVKRPLQGEVRVRQLLVVKWSRANRNHRFCQCPRTQDSMDASNPCRSVLKSNPCWHAICATSTDEQAVGRVPAWPGSWSAELRDWLISCWRQLVNNKCFCGRIGRICLVQTVFAGESQQQRTLAQFLYWTEDLVRSKAVAALKKRWAKVKQAIWSFGLFGLARMLAATDLLPYLGQLLELGGISIELEYIYILYSYMYIGSILLPVTVDDDGSVAGLVQEEWFACLPTVTGNRTDPIYNIYTRIYNIYTYDEWWWCCLGSVLWSMQKKCSDRVHPFVKVCKIKQNIYRD